MNVLFDASWLATEKPGSVMHGGLRVTYELARRLAVSDVAHTNFTLTNLDKTNFYNLQNLVSNDFGLDRNRVITSNALALRIYESLSDRLGTNRGRSKIYANQPFIQQCQLANYDVYHSPVEAIPAEVKKSKHIRPFLTAHDLIALIRPEIAYSGFYEQLHHIYNSIDQNTVVLAVSQSTKNDLLEYRSDIKEENVIVTNIAADKDIFFPNDNAPNTQEILNKYGLKKGNYFFTLSALARFKNTRHTLESFVKYCVEYKNEEVKLFIVGKSREANFGDDIFSEYKSHPQIVFLDFLPEKELSVIYSNAVSLLYMSLYEGFGLPILEAMQCGAPVICSNTSSMPEVIGNAGICIDPTDQDLLCEALNTMYTNTERRSVFSSLGLERSKKFSWEQYTSDVIAAYQRFS